MKTVNKINITITEGEVSEAAFKILKSIESSYTTEHIEGCHKMVRNCRNTLNEIELNLIGFFIMQRAVAMFFAELDYISAMMKLRTSN